MTELFTIGKSILNNCKAIETVNIEKLDKLQYMEGLSGKDKTIIEAHLKSRGELEVPYNLPERGIGRATGKNSIGNLKSELRNTVCDELYWDIDGVNMGINLYAKIYEAVTDNKAYLIEDYITRRDSILEQTIKYYGGRCSRYMAKQLYISLVNGGSICGWRKENNIDPHATNEDFRFAIQFSKEVNRTTSELLPLMPPHFLIKANKKEKPTLSHFLFNTERKFIEQLIIALGQPKNFIYTYDGIMVLRSEFSEHRIMEAINATEYEISKIFSIDTKFIIKEVNEDEKIDVDNITINTNSYNHKKVEFEKLHCKIINSALFAKVSIDGTIITFTKSELFVAYEHIKYTESVFNKKTNDYDDKQQCFIRQWVVDENIRQYEKMDTYPKNCPPHIYNIWRQFSAEDMEKCGEDEYNDELEFLLNHIKILCNHNEEIYNYFIRWIGQMLVYPETKSVFVILISEEGAGKGSLLHLLRKIMGNNKVLESQSPDRDIWGNFNGLMANAFLVAIDELEKQKAKDIAQIKGLITEPTLSINQKGKGQFTINSFHRFLGMTNKENPIETGKNDRRKLIVRCSDELIGKSEKNVEYFKRFYKIIENNNVIRKLYDYLISLDGLDTFNELPIPTSEYHEALKETNVCYVEEYIKSFTAKNMDKESNTLIVSGTKLYQDFNEWIQENGFKYETNVIKICLRLKTLKLVSEDGKLPIVKSRLKSGNCYKFKFDELKTHFKFDEVQQVLEDDHTTMEEEQSDKECEDEIEDNLDNDDLLELLVNGFTEE
jgi:hypothetical protein